MTKQLKTKDKMRQCSLCIDERSLFEKLCDQSNLEAGFKAVKKNVNCGTLLTPVK